MVFNVVDNDDYTGELYLQLQNTKGANMYTLELAEPLAIDLQVGDTVEVTMKVLTRLVTTRVSLP